MTSQSQTQGRSGAVMDRRSTRGAKASCLRCGGLMVGDFYMEMMESHSEPDCRASRCVQCGEVVDPVIQKNRSARADERQVPHGQVQ